MKKTILIVVVVLGFGMISCEKHDCQPNREDTTAPAWDSTSKIGARDGEDEDGSDIGNENNTGQTHGGSVVDTGVTITDPNDDEDGNGRKKKKRRR